jgi:hypothetical protein
MSSSHFGLLVLYYVLGAAYIGIDYLHLGLPKFVMAALKVLPLAVLVIILNSMRKIIEPSSR